MKLEHQVQGKLSSMNCPLAKLSSMNCHLAKLSSRNCLCIPFPWNIQRRPGLGLKLSYFFRLWTLVVFIGTSTSLNSIGEIGQMCLFCWVLQRFFHTHLTFEELQNQSHLFGWKLDEADFTEQEASNKAVNKNKLNTCFLQESMELFAWLCQVVEKGIYHNLNMITATGIA